MRKLIALLFGWDATPRQTTFNYKYLRHPFDDFQYFSVKASDQPSADELAVERFTEMFRGRLTVMTEFWPA